MPARFAAPAAPTRTSLAAQPVSITTAAAGQIVTITSGLNVAATLPASGTWEWDLISVNASGEIAQRLGGLSAGGTVVNAANAALNHLLRCKRIT